MTGAVVVILIDGEWMLPRRPRAGRWTLDGAFDAARLVDELVEAASVYAPVRRIQCYRNWSDQSLGRGGLIAGGLQRRLVEQYHVPVDAAADGSGGYLAPNRDGVIAALRAAAMDHLLHEDGVRVLIASDREDATSGFPSDRVAALQLPSVGPLWKPVKE